MGIVEEKMETESANKKWVISGIQFLTPLKPIYTKKGIRKPHEEEEREDEDEKERCTTPTTSESRINPVLECPGAPRKRKSVSRGHCNGVRDYFKPPELESIFLRCVERA